MLDRFFKLSEQGTSIRTEVIAGFTTFLTMAYIIFVNPQMLSTTGMDHGAVFVATCLAAALGSIAMGAYANYPIALAPGMGLNAYFAFTVVGQLGYSWQVALGAVFLSGCLFLIVSVLPIRQWMINSIPRSLKMAMSAGIGFFLAIIALQECRLVVADPATLVTLGDVGSAPVLLAAGGFAVMLALDSLRVPGAVIIGILLTTVVGIAVGASTFQGIADLPPDPLPVLGQLSFSGVFSAGLLIVIFTFFLMDLFDNTGTLIAVMHRAGLMDRQGNLPPLGKALVVDSGSAMAGAVLGTSTTTSYIESAAGVKAGGRTGLTAVVVGLLFLVALFLAPLALSVPAYATAPALLFVACLMIRSLTELDWEDVTEYAPGVVTALTMPLTFSIATGIGLGFIVYAAGKLLSGRLSQLHPVVIVVSILFIVKFAIT